jgi:hypothetical protein
MVGLEKVTPVGWNGDNLRSLFFWSRPHVWSFRPPRPRRELTKTGRRAATAGSIPLQTVAMRNNPGANLNSSIGVTIARDRLQRQGVRSEPAGFRLR